MNWDEIAGTWKQLKGKAQARWGDLTDDEWMEADGRREQLVGIIQSKYGLAKAAAEKDVDTWLKGI